MLACFLQRFQLSFVAWQWGTLHLRLLKVLHLVPFHTLEVGAQLRLVPYHLHQVIIQLRLVLLPCLRVQVELLSVDNLLLAGSIRLCLA